MLGYLKDGEPRREKGGEQGAAVVVFKTSNHLWIMIQMMIVRNRSTIKCGMMITLARALYVLHFQLMV